MKKNKSYIEKDFDEYYEKNIKEFSFLKDKKILITGVTGMIGLATVNFLIYLREKRGININVIGTTRNSEKTKKNNPVLYSKQYIDMIELDLSENIKLQDIDNVDYIVHAASNSNPMLYATDPVGTMNGNYLGMKTLLEFSKEKKVEKVVFISSGEVYGQISNQEPISEEQYGYIDILSPRSSYPVAKIATETLCTSYVDQYELDITILRLSHVYGPTMRIGDNRAVSHFIRNAIDGKDIELKSEGTQVRNYCYVYDVVLAIIIMLNRGEKGQAYNVSDMNSIISIRGLSEMISYLSKTNILQNESTVLEKKGFTTLSYQVLDNKKLRETGWYPKHNLESGIRETLLILDKN